MPALLLHRGMLHGPYPASQPLQFGIRTIKSMASGEPLYITDVQIKLEHVASFQMVTVKADFIGPAAPSQYSA